MTTLSDPTAQITITPPNRPDGKPIVRDLLTYLADPLGFWTSTGDYGKVVDIAFAHAKLTIVTDADLAHEILQTKNRIYGREERLMDILNAGRDPIMFTSEGDEWMWRRRLMQPAFHRKQIVGFAEAITEETEHTLTNWQDGMTLDIDEAMKQLTMNIIGRTMFNVDMEKDGQELAEAYRDFGEVLNKRILSLVPIPQWLPTKTNRRFAKVQKIVDQSLSQIIESRRHQQEPQGDLLDMLLAARLEDSNKSFTQEQLIGEMSSIVFAGHETTATTLSWLFYLLSEHPDIEAKLHAELDTVLGGATPSAENTRELPYLTNVIKETMRMYPAAYATSRMNTEEDYLGGYCIKPKTAIAVNIIGIHYDERYWDEPTKFDPDRFSAERSEGRHKSAYIPFLSGPRKCIGEPLSMMELHLIVATILQKYKLRVAEGETAEAEIVFVLQPKNGLKMQLIAR